MKNRFKKIAALILSVGIVSASGAVPTYAYEIPEYVRVGLEYKYKDVTSVAISNSEIAMGIEINNELVDAAIIRANAGFLMSVSYKSYIAVGSAYTSYEEALNGAKGYQDLGYKAVPAHTGPFSWNIYICDDTTGESGKLEGARIVNPSAKIMELRDGTEVKVVIDGVTPQIMAMDNNGIIKLNDRSYRGRIEFGRYTGRLMTAVNVVGLEQYLYGSVPAEMPAGYEKEALKAQAVAARSYTMTRIGVHKANGYELCDGTNCQVYKGFESEFVSTNSAVDETKGIIAYYNDQPINAVFFASSGGHTDNAENVWMNPVEYLKAVPELNEVDTNEWTRTFTTEDLNALLSASGDNIGSATDIVISDIGASGRIQELQIVGTNGTKTLTKENIRTFFSGKGGSLSSRMFRINGVGSGDIIVSEGNSSAGNTAYKEVGVKTNNTVYLVGIGHILLEKPGESPTNNSHIVYYIDENGKVVETDINALIANAQKLTAFSSTNQVNTTVNSTSGSTSNGSGTFVFTGKGSGHGVGMSQKGARGMAQKGYPYTDILKYYYTGITIK